VATTPIDKKVAVVVIRNGRKRTLSVKIGRLKGDGTKVAEIEKKKSLGMTVEELTPRLAEKLGVKEENGLVVVTVKNGSPASEAGLKPGDLILEVDRKPAGDLRAFNGKMRHYKKGDTILFLVERDGFTLYLTLHVWE
jgi:serine protease Do